MGLTAAAAEAHIAHWTQYYAHSYRTKWPSRLFHHSPLENALLILKSGRLESRNDTNGCRAKDVAAIGVIDTNDLAHSVVRCYFRPRTPTQFHIEGIRKDADCRLGVNAHAPVLVMFVLNASEILTTTSTKFSDRNMQKTATVQVGDDDAFFATIPFDMVYHEGAYSPDRAEIKDRRAAEVLVTSPLELDQVLQWVLCRSDPERDTLLYLLGDDAERWRSRILVSDDIKVFQKEYPFVQDASLSKAGFTFRINPRPDRNPVSIEINIWDRDGTHIGRFLDIELALPPPNSPSWIWKKPLNEGRYRVQVKLEGHLAFDALRDVGGSLF
jgi:hypothetical protein